ncbi:hypothetical protein [Rhodobium gokarnense]|uniref:Transposase n=1 Tax=Rhodobium gokarnense TaxID=364296 RepID=A0ABT3H709_9HYPH|nr:hypothetical protein [Rhodobium gokarnense]MCW2306187.1 hypothetical protein [Rhodobium gokarnense]
MPVLAQRPDRIDARTYNLWRRARGRWGTPLRLHFADLKEMELVLADSYWVCVDASKNDVPVIAWVELEDENRSALHTDVACKLNYYHFAASALRGRCLRLMEEALGARLRGR